MAPGGLSLQLRANPLRAAWAYGVFRSRSSLRPPCSPNRIALRGFRSIPGATISAKALKQMGMKSNR